MNSQLLLLKTEGICPISEADIRSLFGEPTLEQLETRSHTGSGYFLSSAGVVTSLVWTAEFVGRHFLQVLCQATWRPFFGCIRDQYGHLLCWDFVGTDLVSAESVISGWEADYHALSAWHVSSFCRPDLLGTDNRGGDGHVCYGYPVHLGIRHIQMHGVPRETEPVFSCDVPPPPVFIPPPRIRAIRCLESLEEALLYLPSHPIGAEVIVFHELFKPTTEIYRGPGASKAVFLGYHAVIIEAVIQLFGDIVAVCRMSNGVKAAHFGYAFVSLTTMYMNVGVSAGFEPSVKSTPKPVHLLSNFVIVEMQKKPVEEKPEEEKSAVVGNSQEPFRSFACSQPMPKNHNADAKPDSSSQQEKDQNVEARGAFSSQPQADEKKEESEKPLRRGKRKRSTTTETEKKVDTKSVPRAKRARATKPQAAEPEYFKEKRNLEDLWKDAFPVGTEWGQLDDLYEFNWDFTNLEEALEEDGKLYGKKVYVFGCAESHLVTYKNENKTVLVPAVVCVESSIPPSDKIGISSVEGKEPEITPMKLMKMAWEPYIPLDKRDRQVDRMNFQIYILACTQRRSALKHLKEDRVKKFNYCLPYINNPFKEDESEQSTVVPITFPSEPPVVCEYDWEKDKLEELADDLIKEGLLKGQKDEFQEFVKEQADKAKKAHGEAEEAREKAKAEMSEGTKEAYKEMKLYKFYPSPSPNTPDLSAIDKSSFINRYFGKAHQVL